MSKNGTLYPIFQASGISCSLFLSRSSCFVCFKLPESSGIQRVPMWSVFYFVSFPLSLLFLPDILPTVVIHFFFFLY